MVPVIVVVGLLVVWVAIAGALALALGRAVAVARVHEGRNDGRTRDGSAPLGGVVTTTPGRTSIVRSR